MSTDSSKNQTDFNIFNVVPKVIGQLPKKLPGLIMGGIPALLQSDTDKASIGKILEENALKYGSRPALYFEDNTWTHDEFNAEVNRYAHFLIHHGVKKGQVVIVFLENRPEVLFIVGALAKLGAIASLINSHQKSQTLIHSINQKNDGFFFIGEELLDEFEDIADGIVSPQRQVFLGVLDKGKESFPDRYAVIDETISKFPKTNIHGVDKMTSGTQFAYIFTSGTTGMPKASIQKHRKWLQCMYWFGQVNLNITKQDVIYVSIPFYHANALLIAWSSAASGGAAMAVRRKFSVSEFWKDCIKYQATAFIYIGDILRYLYNAPASELDQKHQVTKIIGNGLRPDIWQAFKERFHIQEVYEFYASSEGNMTFTNTFNLDNTVGWCATSFEIVEYDKELGMPILDSNGHMKKVGIGESGLMIFEISDRYPFPGYVRKEDSSKKIFHHVFKTGDTWFNTGDIMRRLGLMHAQFVDREGDTFRWKGENVSTAEVEQVLNSFPEIRASSVYGVDIPHADGKAGMAAIQLKDGVRELNWKAFELYVDKELPSYAIPVFIRLVHEFEYTSTFKVVKKSLKEEGFQQVKESVWVRKDKRSNYRLLTKEYLDEINAKGL